jgi:hypothetical protein
MDLFNSDITIVGSTITDNSRPASGAAILRRNVSSAMVTASIVVANDGLDPFGDDGTGGTLTVSNTLVDNGTALSGTTIETSDAMLGELQDTGGVARPVGTDAVHLSNHPPHRRRRRLPRIRLGRWPVR